jgi:hypothetical protein
LLNAKLLDAKLLDAKLLDAKLLDAKLRSPNASRLRSLDKSKRSLSVYLPWLNKERQPANLAIFR